MKKTLSALGMVLLVVASYFVGRRQSSHQAGQSTDSRRVLYWVDPMHPDYKSDHPGTAPDCGMALEPVYAEPAASPTASRAPLPDGVVGIDVDKQQLFGIRVATVEKTYGSEKIRVLGRVVHEDTRL